ncbi:MAG: hypothetical protein ABIZ91_18575 [Gemmatimonadaceae bacterium]
MRTRILAKRVCTHSLAVFLAGAVACSSVTDSLLEATDPDLINPTDVASADGAVALYNGGIQRFTAITAGAESTWLFGGLLADEWSSSSTFVQNDETDQRAIQDNNSQVNNMLRRLYRARTSATQAIKSLKTYAPTDRARIGEMYFARGFAELQLASDFCNGIPLSDGTEVEIVFGQPQPVAAVFTTAVASLDSAIATANGTSANEVLVNRAARVAKARAQLGLNQIAQAATSVAGIPTSFAYQHTFTETTTRNTIWSLGLSALRYSVADSVEGNGRNIVVANAIPFGSAKDPRVPVIDTRKAGQDGQTFTRTTSIFAQLGAVDVVNGIDARMIEAEAALKAGNVAQWLSIHNALRAAPPALGAVQPAAMAPLTDPGTDAARINLHFREKAFWTFGRGQRLGDLRRLIRQYGRTAANTFPSGVHYKGGNYGTDVNLPITQSEQNNPNFTQCLDRNA